jgi:ATP synthase protein I
MKGPSRMTKTESSSGSKLQPNSHDEETLQEAELQPWSAEQVRVWRQSQPQLSVCRVLITQLMVAVSFASVVAVWFESRSLGLSWLYGALTVVIPSALFARGLTSRTASVNAMAAALGFMVWQSVKWVLSVLLLVLAPSAVPELSWPALLAGLIVTMKVYWLALVWGRPARTAAPSTTL